MTPMVGTDRIKLDTIFAALAVLLSVLAVVTGNPTPPHMRPSCIQIRLACSVDGSWEDRALFHNHRGHSHRRPILDAPRAGPRAARLQQLTDNFAFVGYGYAKGSVLTDPSLPQDRQESAQLVRHRLCLANARESLVFAGARQRDKAQQPGIQGVDLRSELRMAAIHREGVLREVVGADREEIGFFGENF